MSHTPYIIDDFNKKKSLDLNLGSSHYFRNVKPFLENSIFAFDEDIKEMKVSELISFFQRILFKFLIPLQEKDFEKIFREAGESIFTLTEANIYDTSFLENYIKEKLISLSLEERIIDSISSRSVYEIIDFFGNEKFAKDEYNTYFVTSVIFSNFTKIFYGNEIDFDKQDDWDIDFSKFQKYFEEDSQFFHIVISRLIEVNQKENDMLISSLDLNHRKNIFNHLY
jgi:hypothetical protein